MARKFNNESGRRANRNYGNNFQETSNQSSVSKRSDHTTDKSRNNGNGRNTENNAKFGKIKRFNHRDGLEPNYGPNKFASNDLDNPNRYEAAEDLREDRLEGKNAVLEALKAGRQIDKLWILENMGDRQDQTMARIITLAKDNGTIINIANKQTMDRLSITRAHQGVIAQAAVIPYVEIEDILAIAKERNEDPFIIIADEIQDAYNLGSLFRIAEAAGVHGIVIPKRRQVGLDAITAKASAGAINHVACAKVNNLNQAMDLLKSKGIWVAGLDMDGESVYDHQGLNGPLAIVVGNEGKGLGRLVEKNCDFLISIPMLGKLNSLNAAVATGIAVFEAVRIRQAIK